MYQINKENIEEIMKKYNNFHDCNFININYDIYKQRIEIILELYWTIEENGEYNRSKKNMKMLFDKIKECNIKENESWDFFKEAYIEYKKNEDFGEMICFYNDKEDPLFYIMCEGIEYEEINK